MIQRFLTPLLALALLSTAAVARPADAVDPARLSEHIRVLASDAFAGRGPATPGEDQTLAYIEGAFAAAGLQPAGDDGGWTQTVPLRRFETPGPIRVGFTIGGQPRPLNELDDIVVHTLLPVDHVAVKDAPLVFVGYGVSAPERGWDDFKGYDLRGKIAVVLINDPDFEMDPADPLFGRFDGRAMTYYGRWTYKYEEAARRGAVGVLIVHETAPASYGWPIVRNSNSNAQFDIVRERPQTLHPLVEGWIQRDVAVGLFRAAGLDFEALKARARTAAFRPVELPNASFHADYDVAVSLSASHNVIGAVRGAAHPDEAVLYGAHWDHLGVGQPDARGDRIYNGARDNASGVAGLLELARLFAAAPPPRRSVYFIAFTAEEKGLLGSEFYADHPVTPLASTVAMLNLDTLNMNGPAHDAQLRGAPKSDLNAAFAAALATQGRRLTADAHLADGYFYRADHFSLAKAGVPAVTLEEGLDLLNGGVAAGEAAHQDYIAHRYHQPSDEWRPDFDLRGAAQDLDAWRALGAALANGTAWPDWLAGAEFKAARDATAGRRRP
jgi:Zn-dependent M28 family amino/carboxypeptidase